MNKTEAQAIIARLNLFTNPSKQYPKPLPPQLDAWYCYPVDAGHSIVVAIQALYEKSKPENIESFLVPVPVKTAVWLGWQLTNEGYLIVDVPYNSRVGAIVPPEDEEY